MLFYSSPWAVIKLLGTQYIPSIKPLQIMAFIPLIVALSNVLGYETMLSLGMGKKYCGILVHASILNLAIIVPLIYFQQASGVAIAMFITELFVTLRMAKTVCQDIKIW